MNNSILAEKGEVVRGKRSDMIFIDDTLFLDTSDKCSLMNIINKIAKSITLDFENKNEDINYDIDLNYLLNPKISI